MKKLKFLLLFIFAAAVITGAFLAYIFQTTPKHQTAETIFEAQETDTLRKDSLSIISWNIGYAGLGNDMDFFYDGGSRIQTSKKRTQSNLSGIISTLKKHHSADFILLQEVDIDSKRSYSINEMFEIGSALKPYTLFFASNYNVELVPLPLKSPMGKVSSGILTLAKSTPTSAIRYSYPDKHPFPEGLFMPKRCFLTLRYPLETGKELLIVNTHNSAYDNGEVRKLEMNELKKFIESEYKKGNYIVVGGDWNQNPPTYTQTNEDQEALKHFRPAQIPSDFMGKGWKWISDKDNDSNRFLNQPYDEGKTMTTTIDIFLISPNIEALKIKTLKNNFVYSDHQPIKLDLKLRITHKQNNDSTQEKGVNLKLEKLQQKALPIAKI